MASPTYTLTAATQLPSPPAPSSFVRRNRSRLALDDGSPFTAVGPNIYWLGLDENVQPAPSYPSKGRVLEAMAIASAMGATTVRSTSLGVSFGNALSVENALGRFKPGNDPAWDAIDFALVAARSYNLRLVIPLTDQYDYYHGGIPTFLRWRNLSATDFAPFYDLSSETYADFTLYLRTLLTHTSPYTNLTMATDPTVLAFETGNELGGWTGHDHPPPTEWTRAIAQLLKELAPQTLVLSGSYGVRTSELALADVDMVSDHFYPPSTRRLSRAAALAASADKPLLIGEYDHTDRYYRAWRWAWFLLVLPAVLSALLYATPRRWWPLRVTLRGMATCRCCCRASARRRTTKASGRQNRRREAREGDTTHWSAVPAAEVNTDAATPPPYQRAEDASSPSSTASVEAASGDKALFDPTGSHAELPILAPTPSPSSTTVASATFPPARRGAHACPRPPLIDRPFGIRRWHLSLVLFAVLVPVLAPLLHAFVPSSLSAFFARESDLAALPDSRGRGGGAVVGDLYWSLFGRDDACAAYVDHADGYTLHYPSFSAGERQTASASGSGSGSGNAVARLARHAWTLRGERPYWLASPAPGGGGAHQLETWEDLPAVRCPQEGIVLPDGRVVGGTGAGVGGSDVT
ncbi:hypothetical protein JCM3770_000352 [Rhodotorula araucariae]